MLEIVLIVVAVVVVAIAAILGLAAIQSNTFRVERSTSIRATPEKIFGLINDLRNFNSWNPYVKMDPEIKGSYNGAAAGKGAAYAWESAKVGTGRMEIVDTSPPSKLVMTLEFFKPFPGRNVVEFTVDPKGPATNVTWAMHGPKAFMPKLMGLFFSMDNMIGKSFESGLADLKTSAEA